jgi:hypothetical protein
MGAEEMNKELIERLALEGLHVEIGHNFNLLQTKLAKADAVIEAAKVELEDASGDTQEVKGWILDQAGSKGCADEITEINARITKHTSVLDAIAAYQKGEEA